MSMFGILMFKETSYVGVAPIERIRSGVWREYEIVMPEFELQGAQIWMETELIWRGISKVWVEGAVSDGPIEDIIG